MRNLMEASMEAAPGYDEAGKSNKEELTAAESVAMKRFTVSLRRGLHRRFNQWIFENEEGLPSGRLNMVDTIRALIDIMLHDEELQERVLERIKNPTPEHSNTATPKRSSI